MATPQQPAKKDPDEWTVADAIALRNFIGENPKFIRALALRRPKIEGDTMEARAVTGSDVKGYLDCLDAIELLKRDPNTGADDAGYMDGRDES